MSAATEATGACDQHILKVVIQNLQKRGGLASRLISEQKPDVLLAQEISLHTEDTSLFNKTSSASFTSRAGYGTAIYCRGGKISDVRKISSPHAETGGFIRKKTTIARCQEGIHFVSFHGYNGQPFKSVAKLADHVAAALSVVPSEGPALFAGDFNTWTEEHVDAVTELMINAGFVLAYSWPYPGREVSLDHAFARGMNVLRSGSYENESDHRGAIISVSVCTSSAINDDSEQLMAV
eukprot:CAMPEP_0113542680 /NCGR_PEP_ID=MMETSP0015_2-20120614/9744_1 /TAXON_ID=2838 /ORGANISM="Odontella" /LENGTH=236 /DNA_ID=CAMNT_0000442769 /DNA_START=362 /DNA_END=1072 /DNA_ORIENTATION=- /assembly_acc=CAM_ASM_000160